MNRGQTKVQVERTCFQIVVIFVFASETKKIDNQLFKTVANCHRLISKGTFYLLSSYFSLDNLQ